MKRSGVISWDLLLGMPDRLKQYVLLYDELWVPGINRSYPSADDIEEWDLDEGQLASIAFLSSESILSEPPIDLETIDIAPDDVIVGLSDLYYSSLSTLEQEYPTAEIAALEAGAAIFNIDIALTRLISYIMWLDRKELVYPVVFPFDSIEALPKHLSKRQEVLSVVLKQLPMPTESLPLEDIVFFKKDSDTKYKFAKFWKWVRKTASEDYNKHELEEEIDWLITDYNHHLKKLTEKINNERVEVLITTTVELLEDLVKLRWSKGVKAFFELRKQQVSASDEELKLPGSELAYVTEASRILLPDS
jgi:hypothetical protein